MIIPTDMLLQIAHGEHQSKITNAERRRVLRRARRQPRARARNRDRTDVATGGPAGPAEVSARPANLAGCGHGAASTTR